MSTLSQYKVVFAGLLIAALSGGCEKEVKLTFINTTSQTRDLTLTAPGDGSTYLGVLPRTGGKLKYKLKLDKDLLPATCTWDAGDRSDSFTVNEQSADKMTIAIDPTGNITVDEKTEVRKSEKVEVKEFVVDQQEVVE